MQALEGLCVHGLLLQGWGRKASKNFSRIYFITLFSFTVMYVTSMMVVQSISLAMTVLVISLHHRRFPAHPPRIIRIIVLDLLGRITCARGNGKSRKTRTDDEGLRQVRDDSEKSWAEVARVLDRTFFSVCLITILLITLIVLVKSPNSSPSKVEPIRIS